MSRHDPAGIRRRGFWEGAEVISAYSRAQAIEDGVLVDVSETAAEAGFKVPVAVTQAVWSEVIAPSQEAIDTLGQSANGRLWDVFWMLFVAVKQTKEPSHTLRYKLLVADTDGAKEVTLKAIIGPGDTPDAVMTIMLPSED